MSIQNPGHLSREESAPAVPLHGQVWRFDASSPEEAEMLAQPLETQYFQLGRGGFREQAHAVFLDSLLIATSRLDTAIRFRGAVLNGSLAFQCFRSMAPIVKGHVTLAPDCLAVSRPGEEWDLSCQAAVQALSIVVRERRWNEVVQALGAESAVDFVPAMAAVQCRLADLEQIGRRAEWVLEAAGMYPDCFQRHEIRRAAEIGLVSSVMALMQTPQRQIEHPPPAARRRQAVRKIEAYLETHLAEPLTLADLCRVSGLKMRALQYAFQEKYGVSPMGYLKLTRLDKARRLLSRPHPGNARVTAAALECGLWHLAQFALDYRTMYGELPSQTLRRHQR